jgi:hypothetical protein
MLPIIKTIIRGYDINELTELRGVLHLQLPSQNQERDPGSMSIISLQEHGQTHSPNCTSQCYHLNVPLMETSPVSYFQKEQTTQLIKRKDPPELLGFTKLDGFSLSDCLIIERSCCIKRTLSVRPVGRLLGIRMDW